MVDCHARSVPAKFESLVLFEAFIDWCPRFFVQSTTVKSTTTARLRTIRTTSTADQFSRVLLTAIGTW